MCCFEVLLMLKNCKEAELINLTEKEIEEINEYYDNLYNESRIDGSGN